MGVMCDVMVFVTCCNRVRPRSRTEANVFTLGGYVHCSYRCAGKPDCEARELSVIREAAAQLWRRMQS